MDVKLVEKKSPLAHVAQSLDDCGLPVYSDDSYLLHTQCHRSHGFYGLYFGFLDKVRGVQVTALFKGIVVPRELSEEIADLVVRLNNYLWLGSLSLERETGIISYRHTVMDSRHSFKTAEKMDAYLEHLLNECERVRPAFALVVNTGCSVDLAFESMMLDTRGSC